ncbi:rod shape-determining protein MreD [Patescibacteria group bacterium]|nr:rod shape-determining protein MreD [Patescibacteria group bacterium]MBU4458733.1 rod shape-determining protein MreD [Patescibacteria group bacterium]MCG2696034.1 rod shape-determining protein MreD [Candidatus Portnoybacteria bacterium]
MRIILVIIFILVVLFLQIGIFPHLKIVGVYPNLIFLAVVSLAITKDWKKNLGWIIVSGLFLDFYSLQNILGISVLVLLLTCLLSRFLNKEFLKEENKLSLILIFLISSLFYELLLFIIGSNLSLLGLVAKIIYNSILALPIFYIVKSYAP